MDDDFNRYDLVHVTTEHPNMSREEWEYAHRLAWETYYSPDHIITLMRRALGACTGLAPEGINLIEGGRIGQSGPPS